MAPHKAQAKPGKAVPGQAKKQPSASVAPSRTVVVPAIPLPMMPKQRQPPKANKTAARTTSSANGHPASSLEAALAGHADPVPVAAGAKALHPAKISEKDVNGSNVEKTEHATTGAINGAHNGNNVGKYPNAPVVTNGLNGTSDAVPQMSSAPSIADAESAVGSAYASASAVASANGTNQGAHDAAQHTSHPDQRTSFHHHPNFQLPTDDPANLRGQPHMHHYQHHPHMSSGGGVVFGAFSGSHTPSPAPPPGGFMPPPPPPVNGEGHIHPRPNGRHHEQSGSNGFPGPINTQFPPGMVPVSGSVPQPPFESFSPDGGHYGISTPRSFHGSHTSGEPNGVENGAMAPYPSNGIPYGGHPRHDRPVGLPHPAAPFPHFMHPEHFARHPGIVAEGLSESVMYFQDQFDSGELTDCALELVCVKDLHHPVKITGHKLIFARSPALKQHIMAARATDLGSHTITIESDDPYLRYDAWWCAVRRLYLFPLLSPLTISDEGSGFKFAGDKLTRFEFCLGYAAAGHLLQMRDVFIRGLQMAADFITWDTMEAALGFVFEGTVQRHVNYENDQDLEYAFGYGLEARLLLIVVANLLVSGFPPNFELDTSVAEPPKFARIPVPSSIMLSSSANPAPSIARGTSVRNLAKPNRLSSIKFGDLPAAFPEDGAPPHGPAECSPIISRVLLNLPFHELRAILVSESTGISGWNTAQYRYHAVADVVAEREARRLRAVEAVRAGAVPDSLMIQQRLSAQRRYAIVEPWDVLNWEEKVIQPRGAEVPQIVREWVPQFAGVSEAPQQLQPQPYDVRDSMV
ncbi:hypothetical protein F4677DRAFT_230406 [Hypoxylon crocopeplum]|nr:hypothetical protein F4677DRAFT_230406 [Hypoxylon crocopeplum]